METLTTTTLDGMITRTLELSTKHIKPETNEWLTDQITARAVDGDHVLTVYDKPMYGYWVHVPERSEFAESVDVAMVPTELWGILVFAMTHGCAWVMFDCDAEELEELPTFDW